MLFDFGWSELLLIGVVALIFIGPKDLPKALRVAGFWVRKARTLSREFQSSIDQMIRESELDDIRRDFKQASEVNFDQEFRRTIDPTGSLEEGLKPPELPVFKWPDGAAPASDATAPSAAAETAPVAVEAAPREPELAAPAAAPAVADDDVAFDVLASKR